MNKPFVVSEHLGNDERKSVVMKDTLGYYVLFEQSEKCMGVCPTPSLRFAEDVAEDYVLTGEKYVIREDDFFKPDIQ